MNPNPETTYCVDLYPEGVTVGTLDRLLTANHLIGTDLRYPICPCLMREFIHCPVTPSIPKTVFRLLSGHTNAKQIGD